MQHDHDEALMKLIRRAEKFARAGNRIPGYSEEQNKLYAQGIEDDFEALAEYKRLSIGE